MKKLRKKMFLAATLLCVAGAAICLVGLVAVGADVTKLDTENFVTNTYEINESFEEIWVDVTTADVRFWPSGGENCKVVCYEEEKTKHSVHVKNGTLNIEATDTRKWFEYVSVSYEAAKLDVYLPVKEYEKVTIKTDTGYVDMPRDFRFGTASLETDTGEICWEADVAGTLDFKGDTGEMRIKEVSLGIVEIRTSTGDIYLDSVTVNGKAKLVSDTGEIQCDNVAGESVSVKSDTGEISFADTLFSGSCKVDTDTGSVTFERFDAETITVQTSTGEVKGSLRSEKVFFAQSETGDSNVPKTTTGGVCEITTSTGDIDITIENR